MEAPGDSLPTKNFGEVKFFLGCAFIRDREAGTIEISQESYIKSVLERFDVCHTSPIPASLANDNRSLMEVEGEGDVPLREVVGSLMWIANQTRPDISNAVRAVARHSHEPKKSHWKAAQKSELSSGNGASNSEVQAGQYGRCRHVGVRRCRLRKQGH